jgi:Flp pilus assembly protein TadB
VVVIAALVFGNGLLLLLLPEVLLVEFGALQRRAFKRAESFEADYTALLLSLASSIRTGLDPITALLEVQKLFHKDSEVRRQLVLLKKQIEAGDTETKSIREFARDIDHPDLPLFRTAFLLARKEGSSLGPCLERLARVTRQRQSFRRKARAAVAMQKLSALGIVGCCVVIAIIQFLASPEGFMKAANTPLGQKFMGAGIALLAAGTYWMLRIARVRL